MQKVYVTHKVNQMFKIIVLLKLYPFRLKGKGRAPAGYMYNYQNADDIIRRSACRPKDFSYSKVLL